jgi:sugar lactone lactonase YvrE
VVGVSISITTEVNASPTIGWFNGMRCDLAGNLYVTRWGRGTIAKLSPDGELLQEIPLHGKKCTNIAFGGPDGRTCYVTLADQGNIERFRVEHPGRSWGRVG